MHLRRLSTRLLELLVRRVTDTHLSAAFIPWQSRCLGFAEQILAVNAIRDLHLSGHCALRPGPPSVEGKLNITAQTLFLYAAGQNVFFIACMNLKAYTHR